MKCWKCGNEVTPVRSRFNWIVFILSFFVLGVGWIPYLIYHLAKTPRNCPVCNTDLYPKYKCPYCGKKNLSKGVNPCPKCGKHIKWRE